MTIEKDIMNDNQIENEMAAGPTVAPDADNAGLTQEEINEAIAKELGAVEAAAAADAAGVNGDLNVAAPVHEEAFIEDALPNELTETHAKSIIESVLFASPHPVSYQTLKTLFNHTNIDAEKLWDVLNHLQTDYAGGERGVVLEEVAGGYQLRTKLDNAGWLKKMVKARPFRLSGPALEVLSIIAYKQPVIKSEVDEIRGVESGHLIRALMEKNLVRFAGKSELPGKPMLYATTKNFLELFGLRNIRELPTLSEIDKLIPEGIGEIEDMQEKETLGTLADKIAIAPGQSYSDSENELLTITNTLSEIATTTDFFEQEKQRERDRREAERAQDIRERMIVGELIPDIDQKWLQRFEAKIAAQAAAATAAAATAMNPIAATKVADSEIIAEETVHVKVIDAEGLETETELRTSDFKLQNATIGTDLAPEASEAAPTADTMTVAVAKIATDSEEFEESEVEIQMIDEAEQAKLQEILNTTAVTNSDDENTSTGTESAAMLEVETEIAMAEAASRQASKKKKANAAADDDVDVDAKKRVSAATLAAEAHLAAFMDDDDSSGLDN
jgi:segregation and condensation protein B